MSEMSKDNVGFRFALPDLPKVMSIGIVFMLNPKKGGNGHGDCNRE
jgi:hypothetical protein